jgi:hypothetical protein
MIHKLENGTSQLVVLQKGYTHPKARSCIRKREERRGYQHDARGMTDRVKLEGGRGASSMRRW